MTNTTLLVATLMEETVVYMEKLQKKSTRHDSCALIVSVLILLRYCQIACMKTTSTIVFAKILQTSMNVHLMEVCNTFHLLEPVECM